MNPKLLTTMIATLLSLGFMATTSQEAFAGVGSTISSSKKEGKRTHKLKKRKKKVTKPKKVVKKRTTRKTRVSTRTVSSSPRRTVVRRTTTPSSNRSHRRRVVRRSSHTHRRRHVHVSHHHSHNRAHGHGHVAQRSTPKKRSTIEPYVRGGFGIAALAAPDLSDNALPGIGYEAAIGAKGQWLGAELNVNGGAFSFDDSEQSDITTLGLSLDFKAQPKIGVFEPFAMVGIGGYYLADQVLDEAAGAGAVRLGFGADLRFDNVAVGARYVWSAYSFSNDQSYIDGVGAISETLSMNVALYF